MDTPVYSTGEVARLIGVKPYQIAYAIATGQLPEPARFCGKRLFTSDDMRRLAEFFGVEIAEQETTTTQIGGACIATHP